MRHTDTLAQTRSRRHRRERGSTMVEMAVILPLLFTLTFGIFEFGRLFYVQLTLLSAVREASRYTITGASAGGLSRPESIADRVNQTAPGLGLDPSSVTVSGPGGAGDAGGAGDLVTIQVDYDIDLLTPLIAPLFPNGTYHYTVKMIARNEPFPEG